MVGINWTTFTFFNTLERFGREEPLLKLRMKEREEKRELVWRRKRWELDDLKKEVENADVDCIVRNLLGEREGETRRLPLATVAGLWTTL